MANSSIGVSVKMTLAIIEAERRSKPTPSHLVEWFRHRKPEAQPTLGIHECLYYSMSNFITPLIRARRIYFYTSKHVVAQGPDFRVI